MATEKDPWAPESGLLTNYEGTIVDAWFGTDPNYNPDTRMLMLKMTTDAPEKPEHEERYNLPPDWETWDSGKTVEHKSEAESKTKTKTFNMASQVGQLIVHIRENCPEAIDVLRARGTMREAGLSFFWEETAEVKRFKDKQTGEWREVTVTKNFPTKFLGVAETLIGGVSSDQVPVDDSSPETQLLSTADKVVVKMLSKSNEHGVWVEKVMEFDGGRLLTNPELVAALADDGEGSLYATLRNET